MGSDREQELARTLTAAPSAPPGPAAPVGATLGRYRLERELGAGAMGVVHAAFDPDLERRIALKVLRGATATAQARDRLLREARAMARLSHPNVVTVHEVGTAGGRDYVAMELIVGESLAEWLRASHRSPAAILDAFRDAGRGLAAAHAAGIVHRDFKPHNVLRGRDGRIVVTDFGLAREAHGALPPALDVTLPIGELTTASASSPLVGLTMTGALLGTPAYMAPEQWSGGAVTPATDQFAFCVALWEALAGQRPYPGPTLDDLRAQVGRGPAALDASRIPRRVRGLLRRGLDPDPARRWPGMDALLTRLVRVQRRPGVALALAGGALAVAAVVMVGARRDDAPIALCDPPARDLAAVWSPAIRADLAARLSDAHAAVLDTAVWSWRAARGATCAAPSLVRRDQLACLDGVLARLDAVRQALVQVPDAPAEEIQAQLIDPAICRKPAAEDVPRLRLGASPGAPPPAVIAAYALYARSQTEHKPADAEIDQLIAAPTTDPCGRVVATLAFHYASHDVPRARSLVADAIAAADQCGDERLKAELLIRDNRYQWERPMIGPRGDKAIRRAQIAVARVDQPDLAAALSAVMVSASVQRARLDEALQHADAAVAGYRARSLPRRMLGALIQRNAVRLKRNEPADLDALAADVRAFLPLAVADHQPELARQLAVQDANARFQRGDVAGAHADLVRLWHAQPAAERARPGRRITGEVVDPAGHPIAGARIAASLAVLADAVGVDLPNSAADTARDDSLRVATSDAAGRFAIEDAVNDGAIAAALGDRRSMPAVIADHVKLVLEPTRSVTGKVDLARRTASQVAVIAMIAPDPLSMMLMVAPVAPDGSFTLAGAPVRGFEIGAALHGADESDEHLEVQPVPAGTAPVAGLALGLERSQRTIDVILRSTVTAPLEGAEVVVFAGTPRLAKLSDLRRYRGPGLQFRLATPAAGAELSAEIAARVRPGDLVARIAHAGLGALTVCGFGFAGDLADPQFWERLQAHRSQVAMTCAPITPDVRVLVLAVPPQQRLE